MVEVLPTVDELVWRLIGTISKLEYELTRSVAKYGKEINNLYNQLCKVAPNNTDLHNSVNAWIESMIARVIVELEDKSGVYHFTFFSAKRVQDLVSKLRKLFQMSKRAVNEGQD